MRQPVTTTIQIGEILRARRKARHLSQAEIALKLGVSQGRISTLEADPGAMTLERFLHLAKLLGLELVVEDARSKAPPTEW